MSKVADRPHSIQILLTLVTIFLTVVGLWLNNRAKPTEPSFAGRAPLTTQPSTTSELAISTADLHVWKHQEHVFMVLPSRMVWFYSFDAVLANKAHTELKGCFTQVLYTLQNGGNGSGALFAGNWPAFYDKGSIPFFNLPDQNTLTQQFFFEGPRERPAWLRLRIICQQPAEAISPWYDVDLVHSIGW